MSTEETPIFHGWTRCGLSSWSGTEPGSWPWCRTRTCLAWATLWKTRSRRPVVSSTHVIRDWRMSNNLIKILRLGEIEYLKALKLQEHLVKLNKKNVETGAPSENILLLLQHKPVYTTGIRTKVIFFGGAKLLYCFIKYFADWFNLHAARRDSFWLPCSIQYEAPRTYFVSAWSLCLLFSKTRINAVMWIRIQSI